jgi:hypothetical protein
VGGKEKRLETAYVMSEVIIGQHHHKEIYAIFYTIGVKNSDFDQSTAI